mgnify:CR=1 FL=1
MNYAESVVDLVGNTPLVKLGTVAREAGVRATVLAKVEYFNPGGSVKDRIALKMIEAAEASGELKPGGTIVEPTSGNTGVGLALVAQRKGYRCIFVCPDKVAKDKMDVLRAYGAQVVVTPTSVAPDHPDAVGLGQPRRDLGDLLAPPETHRGRQSERDGLPAAGQARGLPRRAGTAPAAARRRMRCRWPVGPTRE